MSNNNDKDNDKVVVRYTLFSVLGDYLRNVTSESSLVNERELVIVDKTGLGIIVGNKRHEIHDPEKMDISRLLQRIIQEYQLYPVLSIGKPNKCGNKQNYGHMYISKDKRRVMLTYNNQNIVIGELALPILKADGNYLSKSKWEIQGTYKVEKDGVILQSGYAKFNGKLDIDDKTLEIKFQNVDAKTTRNITILKIGSIELKYRTGYIDLYVDGTYKRTLIGLDTKKRFLKKNRNKRDNDYISRTALTKGQILKVVYKGISQSDHPDNLERLINDFDYNQLKDTANVTEIHLYEVGNSDNYTNTLFTCIMKVDKMQQVKFGISGDDDFGYAIYSLEDPETYIEAYRKKPNNQITCIKQMFLKPGYYLVCAWVKEFKGTCRLTLFWKGENDSKWKVFGCSSEQITITIDDKQYEVGSPGTLYAWNVQQTECMCKEFIESANIDLSNPIQLEETKPVTLSLCFDDGYLTTIKSDSYTISINDYITIDSNITLQIGESNKSINLKYYDIVLRP